MKKCIAKLVVTLSIGFMICSFCSEVNAKESNTGAMLNDPFVQSNSQKVINFESRLDESGLGDLDKNDTKMGDPYVAGTIKNSSNPMNTFTSRIITDLKGKMKAPIILLQTKYLPRYNGKDCRHYNTVCGYSHEYSTGAKSIQTVDPHYSQLYYGTWWSPLGTFSGNGLFKAVYEADKAGSNMAMAY